MIHNYYCTNCGHKIPGEEIVFDLAQILDLSSGQKGKSLFIKFTPADLQEVAERNGENLHAGRVQLKLSIYDLLGYMGQDLDPANQDVLQGLTYEEFATGPAMSDLFTGSFETPEVAMEKTGELVKAITSKFVLEEPDDGSGLDGEWEESTSSYVIRFWVEAIFFEKENEGDADKIYTIEYSCKENPPHLMRITYNNQTIRGYCPICCEPVLRESGRYEHVLVGFLGAQRVGKTSLFVSMVNYLEGNYTQFELEHPEVLCDGKYDRLTKAIEANCKGWAVGKTDAEGAKEAYNASLLIKKGERKTILSFIDIAGERCWDEDYNNFNQKALDEFPLIANCHMYLLCGDIRTEGGKNENKAFINNHKLIKIAEALYSFLDEPLIVPPMCLVVTKIDLARGTATGRKEDNPFAGIVSRIAIREAATGGLGFNMAEQVKYLEDVYDSSSDHKAMLSLKECRNVFHDFRNKIYISMIGCSALGMPGRSYEDEVLDARKANRKIPDYDTDGDKFVPVNLKQVWQWIFCNMGIIPVWGGYSFSHIPSYGEAYKTPKTQWSDKVRLAFEEGLKKSDRGRDVEIREAENRTKSIYGMYLNPSQLDKNLYIYYENKNAGGGGGKVFGFFASLTGKATNEAVDIIEEYIKNL